MAVKRPSCLVDLAGRQRGYQEEHDGTERAQSATREGLGHDLAEVMADVTIDIGSGLTVAAAITRDSVERMGLTEGDDVMAIIKATEVMVGKQTGS